MKTREDILKAIGIANANARIASLELELFDAREELRRLEGQPGSCSELAFPKLKAIVLNKAEKLLAEDGQKLKAIKMLRERYGQDPEGRYKLSLMETKEAVQAYLEEWENSK